MTSEIVWEFADFCQLLVIFLWKTEKVTNGYKSVKNGYIFVKYKKADTFFANCSQEENACKIIISDFI